MKDKPLLYNLAKLEAQALSSRASQVEEGGSCMYSIQHAFARVLVVGKRERHRLLVHSSSILFQAFFLPAV